MAIKTIYTVKAGDRITRIATSNNITTEEIVNANPAVFTPARIAKSNTFIAAGELDAGEMLIYAGEKLSIPSSEIDDLKEEQTIKADSEDELNIFIADKKCPLPHEFVFTEYFDSCSDSFELTYPYDPQEENPVYSVDIDDYVGKGLPQIKIYLGSEMALSGSIESVANNVTPASCSQSLAGRSATFLLEKSDIFPNIPREFIDQTWEDIAKVILGSYSLRYEIADNVDLAEAFSKINLEDGEKPFAFLARLAKERACLLGKTGDGKLLVHKAESSDPVANFKIEAINNGLAVSTAGQTYDFIGVQSITMTFDTRDIYGQYQGKTTTVDDQDLECTIQSSVLLQQSIKISEISEATEQTLRPTMEWEEQKTVREFYKNSIPFPAWINPNNNERWKPGQTITLQAKEAGIKEPKLMMIRYIEFNESAGGKRVATLYIVPAETYL